MAKIRIQMAPEIEFKMEMEVAGVDPTARDYDIQQQKVEIYQEFERRIKKAFPEGYLIHTFQFGVDRGWHKEPESK